MEKPALKENDIIFVGNTKCIVRRVYEANSPFGAGEVVFEGKSKPTSHDVDWKDGKWYFPDRPDFGGYVPESDPFLNRLRRL